MYVSLADVILISFIRFLNKYLSAFPVLQILFLIILFMSIICNPNLCAGCVRGCVEVGIKGESDVVMK